MLRRSTCHHGGPDHHRDQLATALRLVTTSQNRATEWTMPKRCHVGNHVPVPGLIEEQLSGCSSVTGVGQLLTCFWHNVFELHMLFDRSGGIAMQAAATRRTTTIATRHHRQEPPDSAANALSYLAQIERARRRQREHPAPITAR
jgi:hypothetical protein